MTIVLSDIPTAVTTYLNTKVKTDISPVTADSGSLSGNPPEEGTFTVTVTNAAAPTGLRLINVVHHLTTTNPDVLLLKVNPSAALATRASLDPTAPHLPRNTFVEEMYVTYAFGTLDVGQVLALEFEVKAIDEGSAAITCHVHADIDEDSLFPDGLRSKNDTQTVTVI
jgi:hypothetical protein